MDLGLERAGMVCKWQVEIDDYATKVLEKHWPETKRYRDVRTFPPEGWSRDDVRVDVIAGGFPCQDISYAGKGKGIKKGTRSGLWAEFARIIRILRPKYVIVENVSAILARGLDTVMRDLASLRYDAEWEVLPAATFGAPHNRERFFLIAYPSEVSFRSCVFPNRKHGIQRDILWNTTQGIKSGSQWKRWLNKACAAVDGQISCRDFCGMDDGLSKELVRTGSIGNAVVPQIAEWIGKQIIRHAQETGYLST